MEKEIRIDSRFAELVPGYVIVYLEADVCNGAASDSLISEFDARACEIAASLKIEDISKLPPVAATRRAYKTCGKDPNRYRPSQEQLMRRIVRGLGLYHVNALVDAGNLVSLSSGSSLGVFDRDKISGDVLTVGIGMKDEPYEGIGRGPLNIEGLPVVRDSIGGIGTPTSDNERTKVDPDTRRISICMNLYDTSSLPAEDAQKMLRDVFSRHCNATNVETVIVPASKA